MKNSLTLMPFLDVRSLFAGNPAAIAETAPEPAACKALYLIIAAWTLSLDCGPMSDFNADKVNAEFFPDGKWRANFLCNLGYRDKAALHPRAPRLAFYEACMIL